MSAGRTTIFRLEIVDKPTGLTAYWDRPEHFVTDGETFSEVKGPMVRCQSRSMQLTDGDLELTFDDPRAGSTPDIFRLHRVDSGHISVTYEHTTFEPFDFVRTSSKPLQLGRWEPGAVYVRKIPRSTNVELTAMFDADQADRRTGPVDWPTVSERDRIRRVRTGALLDSGQLQSGDDYYHGAFIFQHGNTPNDFLKAHLLAMIAVARGKSTALWIASASLDRYLQSTGKPQVLGTQFWCPPTRRPRKSPMTAHSCPTRCAGRSKCHRSRNGSSAGSYCRQEPSALRSQPNEDQGLGPTLRKIAAVGGRRERKAQPNPRVS